MTFMPSKLVNVYYNAEEQKMLVGRLALRNRKILFEYSAEFINTGLELSPFKLPLKSGVIVSGDFIFDGLFGVFNDSLPDGWIRLLLDRKLMNEGINPQELSPLDRLCFVGHHGMGALSYEPATMKAVSVSNIIDLDIIANEIKEFQDNDNDCFVDDLLSLGGSSAGARPKVLLNIEGNDWIIKFRSSIDPKDIGNIEYAYHLMAKAAKLDVPEARLFPSRTGAGFFGVKRFDRMESNLVHMHTVSGLLHADHRMPSLDYQSILRATLYLTRDIRQCEKQFRVSVFNVLAHNRDDHAKNFSFLMDKNGAWQVSPAYDLTFSSGPSGEHCSMVMGEGKNPGMAHLLKLATTVGIKKTRAVEIIDEVKSAVSQWSFYADQAGVSVQSKQLISSVVGRALK